MKEPTRSPLAAARILLMSGMVGLLMLGAAFCAPAGTVVDGALGDVRLITGDVLELEFSNPVLNDADARATFEILIDGEEVYPDEVEQVLRVHPKVEDVMVVKEKLKPENFAIKAVVVLKESCSQEELLMFCRNRLASPKIPHLIEFREELPRSWKAVIDGMGQTNPMWGEF